MNARTLICAAALVAAIGPVWGCTEINPVDGIKTQIEARGGAQSIANNVEAERKVQEYQAKHGENPPSLEALEQSVGKIKTPAGFAWKYDPVTAKIELVDVRPAK